MSKLLQIYEKDVFELQSTLGDLLEHHSATATTRQRTQWRRVQEILKSVQWNYGPHTEVEVIAHDGFEQEN